MGQSEQQVNPGFTLLKVLIMLALCAILLNLATFAFEAWRGTLDTHDFYRFMPKLALDTTIIVSVLRRMKIREDRPADGPDVRQSWRQFT